MNNVFSIKRIAALLNYEYSNSKKTHLTVFCALFACFLLFSFYNQIYDYNDAKVFAEEQKSIVSFLFILTMCIAASRHSKTEKCGIHHASGKQSGKIHRALIYLHGVHIGRMYIGL